MTRKRATPKGARIIAVANAKGGVGKTTSTANLGAELARRGSRVLLVDLDWQADLSSHLGIVAHENTIGDVLLGLSAITDCVRATTDFPTLHLLPSAIYLAVQEPRIYALADYHLLLRKVLAPIGQHYDYILLDCPPNPGTMTYMAFCAAQALVVPSAPSKFSFDKLPTVIALAQSIQHSGENPHLHLAGIFFTKYNPALRGRTKHDIVALTTQRYGAEMVLPNIRDYIAVEDAQAFGETLLTNSPDSNAVADYNALTTAILAKL